MAELTEANYEELYRSCDTFGGLSNAIYDPSHAQLNNSAVKTWEQEINADDEQSQFMYNPFIKTEVHSDIKMEPGFEWAMPTLNPAAQRLLEPDLHQARIERLLPKVPFAMRNYLQDVLAFIYDFNKKIIVPRPDAIFSADYDFLPPDVRQTINIKLRAGWQVLNSPNSDAKRRQEAQLFLMKQAKEMNIMERWYKIHNFLPEVWQWVAEKRNLGNTPKAQVLATKINFFLATFSLAEKEAVRKYMVQKDMERVAAELVDGGGKAGVTGGMGNTGGGMGTVNTSVEAVKRDMRAVNAGMETVNGSMGSANVGMGFVNGTSNGDTMGTCNWMTPM